MLKSWANNILTIVQVIHLTRALPHPQRSGESPEISSRIYTNTTHPSNSSYHDGPIPAASISSAQYANTRTQDTTTPVSTITIIDADLQLRVVNSTDLPQVQSPTSTSATQNYPDTSGDIPSSLETGGNPRIQPFPTSLPTISSATLQPLTNSTTQGTTHRARPTTTQVLSVPTTTEVTVISQSRVATLPVQTEVTYVSVATRYITVTQACTLTSKVESSATVTATSITLIETTVVDPSTSTTVLATTITTGRNPATIQSDGPKCSGGSMACNDVNLFLPVGIGEPPANIPRRNGHLAPRLGIENTTEPIETNKFYANFFLGSQTQSTFTHPYGLAWSRGGGNAQSYGMSISHVESQQRVFGPTRNDIPGSPASYFINPIGIQSMIMSAAELGPSTVLTTDSIQAFSANIHLRPFQGSRSFITFPMVQGMAFVTGLYRNLQPTIQSSVFFNRVVAADSPAPGIFKYRCTLEDGKVWLVYAMPNSGIDPNFQLVSSTLLQGLPSFSGTIQIAKNPVGSESLYDTAVGVYPVNAQLSGKANGPAASYSFSWSKGGPRIANTSLLIFALPHHVESFDSKTRGRLTTLIMSTTTKGLATAVRADSWTMVESDLPNDMGFAPWRPHEASFSSLSKTAVNAIQQISAVEMSQNMSAQTNLDSMYFSGKALSKFATIAYTMHELSGQQGLARAGLEELKRAFAVFTNNRQKYPLFYDNDWKGVVSSATYVTGDAGMDFGNSFYNDHHFHYGYFIHAAAIIGYLDPSWLTNNQDYVNTLVRDASNPSSQDQFFPVFRAFDWYAGHSWAKGLFESADGKDQESTSEDAMFAYALKMWGQVVGDKSMEARGTTMLAVLSRTLRAYFLMESTNVNQPAEFIGNKVTGIMFDNKIDHTTYFGAFLEYIQGIHMIPLMPFSTFSRSKNFVSEEWETYFADGKVAQAQTILGGWKGILYGNLAIINPTASFNFFNQDNFDPSWIDGGASRTWYMAYAAGLGGSK